MNNATRRVQILPTSSAFFWKNDRGSTYSTMRIVSAIMIESFKKIVSFLLRYRSSVLMLSIRIVSFFMTIRTLSFISVTSFSSELCSLMWAEATCEPRSAKPWRGEHDATANKTKTMLKRRKFTAKRCYGKTRTSSVWKFIVTMDVLWTQAILLHQIFYQTNQCCSLHGCPCVCRSTRKIIQASNITNSDRVLIMAFAMCARHADVASFVYCAILGNHKMVSNVQPSVVLAMPSLNLFNRYRLHCKRGRAMQNYLIDYSLRLTHFALKCFEGVLICSWRPKIFPGAMQSRWATAL